MVHQTAIVCFDLNPKPYTHSHTIESYVPNYAQLSKSTVQFGTRTVQKQDASFRQPLYLYS